MKTNIKARYIVITKTQKHEHSYESRYIVHDQVLDSHICYCVSSEHARRIVNSMNKIDNNYLPVITESLA